MQTMAAHVTTRYDETERLRKQATAEAETLRTDLTRLTQKDAELTRECANRYSQQQHDEAKRQATTENDTKLDTLRVEMENLFNVSSTEIQGDVTNGTARIDDERERSGRGKRSSSIHPAVKGEVRSLSQ